MNGTRRIIYITLGTFFLILGAIGIFVPLLPTTPFSKIITIAIMWLSTIITSLLLVGYWWVKALLGLISIGVSWHILSYPTKKE